LFKDCDFVTKHTSENTNSVKKVKKLKNNLKKSRLYLKLLDDYMEEFVKAKKELKDTDNK
jgi:hypothetical protein